MKKSTSALLAFYLLQGGTMVAHAQSALPELPALKANPENITVSGLSSGGYMAVQFHVAHSTLVQGAAILAAGPYYCAQGTPALAVSACMSPSLFFPVPSLERMTREAIKQGKDGQIDAPGHLKNSRVWLLSGGKDTIIKTEVVDATYDFYQTWLPASAIQYERVPDAGHAMLNPAPDAKDANTCSISDTPYINHCNDFDAPGRFFAHLLGQINPPANVASGELLAFDQSKFTEKTAGMDKKAYVYIPNNCREGGCNIHVAFHGCDQQAEKIGETYVKEAGYNRWAKSNKLIVLYPQIVSSATTNPHGCWDWWGYTGENYHLRSAPQIKAVKAMLDRLAAGHE
jgi:poly(3-hydroxybutyrate) depolymerase